MAVVAVTNASILDDDDGDDDDDDDDEETVEELAGVNFLDLDPLDNTRQNQEEHAKQFEGLGAIRAVQKKILKLADEATTATASAPNTLGSNITLSGISVGSDGT
ncbi:uncharacterized protein A1O5_00366 [Cladophialophora psammophila CBS 110553]|uniref:Uncharacterized protein n=1 Tax=Cladophialophora psammophila CBS 110553 TaxID=1182543 RepID=W9Y053_9EURO|nr:uncharacterized protein A1O5_00366 [Cladophialophora psammophila CBS 110553]EXJ75859.1 hypothetical protein A1O5_00366 [Cladophialophora psammophila CBS 110553]